MRVTFCGREWTWRRALKQRGRRTRRGVGGPLKKKIKEKPSRRISNVHFISVVGSLKIAKHLPLPLLLAPPPQPRSFHPRTPVFTCCSITVAVRSPPVLAGPGRPRRRGVTERLRRPCPSRDWRLLSSKRREEGGTALVAALLLQSSWMHGPCTAAHVVFLGQSKIT